MKTCGKCKKKRQRRSFHKDKYEKDGLRNTCKKCVSEWSSRPESRQKHNARDRANYHKDIEAARARYREKYSKSDAIYLKNRRYAEKYPEKIKHWGETAHNKRPGSMRARAAKKTAKHKAPKWLTKEQWTQMEEIYAKAVLMQGDSNHVYHVDHIVPLHGKDVTGLHVPWNLQILTAEENIKKTNKFNGLPDLSPKIN